MDQHEEHDTQEFSVLPQGHGAALVSGSSPQRRLGRDLLMVEGLEGDAGC